MDSRVTATGWRKSSRSSGNGGNCVEVGQANRDVAVRDTKDRQGPVLAFTPTPGGHTPRSSGTLRTGR